MTESSRRQFLRLASGALLIPLLPVQQLQAAPAPALQEDEALAKAFDYRKLAADAVKEKLPGFVAGSQCDNCLHYTAGNQGCNLFRGKTVEPGGWCKAWIKKK